MFELQAALYKRISDKYDIEVTVFYDGAKPFQHEGLRSIGVPSGYGPFAHRLEKSFGITPYRRAAAHLGSFDVIETSDPTLYAYPRVAAEVAERFNRRLVCGSSVTLTTVRSAAAMRAKQVTDVASAIVCITPLAAQRFQALGIVRSHDPRVHVTCHPVDPEVFVPSSEREKTVFTAARLATDKGLIDALDAFESTPPDWTWKIAGEGPLEQKLRTEIAARGLADRVQMLGHVPHAEMIEHYARASVLLHLPHSTPHWEEYFGAVLIEAMSAGCAVVTNRTGAIPYVVGNVGVITEGYAGPALRSLCEDPARLESLGEAGRERIKTYFAIDVVAERVVAAWTGGPRPDLPLPSEPLLEVVH